MTDAAKKRITRALPIVAVWGIAVQEIGRQRSAAQLWVIAASLCGGLFIAWLNRRVA